MAARFEAPTKQRDLTLEEAPTKGRTFIEIMRFLYLNSKRMFSAEEIAARYDPYWEEAPTKQREEIDARIDLTLEEAPTKQITSAEEICAGFGPYMRLDLPPSEICARFERPVAEIAAILELRLKEASTKQRTSAEERDVEIDLISGEAPTKRRTFSDQIALRFDLTSEEAPTKQRTFAEPTKDMRSGVDVSLVFLLSISYEIMLMLGRARNARDLMKKGGFVRSALATLLATITFIAACVFPRLIAYCISDYDTGRIVHGKRESAITLVFILLNSMGFVVSLAVVISSLRSFPSKPLPQISVSMFYVSYICLIMKVSPWDACLVLFLSVPLLLLAAAGKLCNYAE